MADLNNIKVETHYHASGSSWADVILNFFKGDKKNHLLTKQNLQILFIDDNKFPMVDNLKKAGYSVDWTKDIKRDDDLLVKKANVIFIDYKGVGKNLSHSKEGIGVCQRLKKVYGKNKYVVLSTGESIPNELLREVSSASDEILVKSSETADFISTIEKAIERLNHEIRS